MGDDATAPAESPVGADERAAAPADEQADAAVGHAPPAPDAAELTDAEPPGADEPSVSADSLAPPATTRWPTARTLTLVGGVIVVLLLAVLTCWLGFHAYQSERAKDRRAAFLQVGKQAAVNLTTIDVEHVEDDVRRIVDSATGQFYDDFQQRAQPFIEVVKQVKSKSVGTVTEAGLQIPDGESAATVPDSAEVLVAVTVNTSIANQPEQGPRAWRMRIQVQEDDGQPKVAKVDFVP